VTEKPPLATSFAVGLAIVAAAGLYGPIALGVARQWWVDPVSSHGVLLVAAAAFVLRRRWAALRALPAAPRNWGFVLLAGALLLYITGTLAGDVFTRRVSLPFTIAGIVVALLGTSHLRLTLAPLSLLLIAVPLPGVLVTHLTLPLQLASSQVGAGILQTAGVEVVRQGNLLILRDITLEVADICSGLRSLVSLVSVAAMFGAILSLAPQRAIFLIVAAAPVAVIGNGVRVAATGVMTTWIGEAAVRGALHDLTGYVAFIMMCAVIILLQLATRSRSALATVS
jgi:exosortase